MQSWSPISKWNKPDTKSWKFEINHRFLQVAGSKNTPLTYNGVEKTLRANYFRYRIFPSDIGSSACPSTIETVIQSREDASYEFQAINHRGANCSETRKRSKTSFPASNEIKSVWSWGPCLAERYTIGTNAGIGTAARSRWRHEHQKGDNFVAGPSKQTDRKSVV